jgi:Ca2+-binding EF-hand superfamily protein
MSKQLTPEEAEHLKKMLKEAFDHFDADKNGQLDAKEFESVAKKFNETSKTKLSDAKIKETAAEFIKSADKDGDGKVNFYEFYRFMSGALGVKC